jgi:hypothetical protein
MGKNPAFLFYPADWRRDLDDSPLEIEGSWIRIICRLWDQPEKGKATKTLKEWSRILRKTERKTLKILQILIENDVASGQVLDNQNITIISRRMVKDERIRKLRREVGRLGGNPGLMKIRENLVNQTPNQKCQSSVSVTVTKNKYVEDSIEFRLASFLLEEILKNKSDLKKPNLQTWAKEINLMIKRDGRAPDRIREVIVWAEGDSFWRLNILSPKSLREKFDRLELAMDLKKGRVPEVQVDHYQDLTGGGRA